MSEAPQAPALWQLLQHTASAVQAVMAGKSLTAQLEAVSAPLRPGTQALSFQVMRELGRAKALRALLAPKAPPPAANALLCSALALCWDDARAPYPAHTLVNQAVEAARRNRHTQAQAGFINACLRRFLRERSSLVAQTAQDAQAVWNHPSWWITRLQQDHPASAQAWLLAAQQAAPMTLRVHQGRHTVAEYQDRLAAAGMPRGRAVGLQGLELAQAVPVQRLPGFAQGDVSVQDAAAQVAAQCLLQGLAQDHPWRVLDACAAPGGKTGHLLELCPQAQVLALEIDPVRAQRIHQNLERLSVQAQVLTADAADPDAWWDGQSFDAILLDAPCTASGIVRRHPDVRWLRREGDSAQLAQLQLCLLERLWPLLRPGGRLLYCTCSVFRTEGVEVVQAFLARNTRAILRPSPGHLIAGTAGQPPSVEHNPLGDHDSFYYALLEKARNRFERGLWLLLALWASGSVWAGAEFDQLRVERQDGALVLHASLKLELGAAVEDALLKGVPVHFVAEAELMRDRWYWYDQKVVQISRHYRLAYQPLTRQWRLQVGSDPLATGAAGGSLAQSFDTLSGALDAVRRQTGWRLIEAGEWEPDARQYLSYRFRLDISQLPRPFQMAAGSQTDWTLNLSRTLRLQPER